jgi:isohexenylglutaconyl-CoA hydratase
MLGVGEQSIPALLDQGAAAFAEAARGPEGVEGMTAFLNKERPSWAKA